MDKLVPWKGGLESHQSIPVRLTRVRGDPGHPPELVSHRWEFTLTDEQFRKIGVAFHYDYDKKHDKPNHRVTLWAVDRDEMLYMLPPNFLDKPNAPGTFIGNSPDDKVIVLEYNLEKKEYTVRRPLPRLYSGSNGEKELLEEGYQDSYDWPISIDPQTGRARIDLQPKAPPPSEIEAFKRTIGKVLPKLAYQHESPVNEELGGNLKAKEREQLFWSLVQKLKNHFTT